MIQDGRDASRVTLPLADILRARIFTIDCGYETIDCGHEDAGDLDSLLFDPAFKLACGRLPDSRRESVLAADDILLENAADLRSVIRLGGHPRSVARDRFPKVTGTGQGGRLRSLAGAHCPHAAVRHKETWRRIDCGPKTESLRES
jgi:hypothetical protein